MELNEKIWEKNTGEIVIEESPKAGVKKSAHTVYGTYTVGPDIPAGTYDLIVGAYNADIEIRRTDGTVDEYFLARNGGPLDARIVFKDGDVLKTEEPVIIAKAALLEFE